MDVFVFVPVAWLFQSFGFDIDNDFIGVAFWSNITAYQLNY